MFLNGGDDLGALIVDVGSHTTRVGYAGEDCPKQQWNSCIGLRHTSNEDGGDRCEVHFPLSFTDKLEETEVKPCLYSDPMTGNYHLNEDSFEIIIGLSCENYLSYSARSRSCQSSFNSPPDDGSLTCPPNNISHPIYSSNQYPICYRNIVSCGLGENLSEKPILLTEPNVHSRSIRRKMAEIIFESYDCPALYLAKRAMLTTFAMGRSSGLVVDIGAATTSITPVTDGYALSNSLQEYPIGGNTLDKQLFDMMQKNSYSITPYYAVSKKIKDIGKSYEVTIDDCVNVSRSYKHYSVMEVMRHLKEAICRVAEDDSEMEIAQSSKKSDFHCGLVAPASLSNSQFHELPDGTRIHADQYIFKVPEILFCPSLISDQKCQLPLRRYPGLSTAVVKVVNKVESDFRKEILNAIMLTGGCSMLPSLAERLNRHLQEAVAVGGTTKLKVVAAQGSVERRYSSWIGGSILASLGSFQQIWMSLEEYREHGSSLVERKCI